MDRAADVLNTSLSDSYVVSTDQLASSESVVVSETEQKASELDQLHNLMKEKLTTATYSEKTQILHQIYGPTDTVQIILIFQNI